MFFLIQFSALKAKIISSPDTLQNWRKFLTEEEKLEHFSVLKFELVDLTENPAKSCIDFRFHTHIYKGFAWCMVAMMTNMELLILFSLL
jgi:hypothetical protein